MKTITVIGGKLALICAVAAFSLGLVNAVTAPRIEELRRARLQAALAAVVPEGSAGEYEEVAESGVVRGYYPVTSASGEKVGYVLRLVGSGYGGDLNMIASYLKAGTVHSAVLMDNQETPGLGKEAEKPEYMRMFKGTGGEKEVPYRKSQLPQDQADAISGATITFSGIGKALNTGSEFAAEMGGTE
ncbi:FMN-binding protein [Marispirochaeta aestuarii]|uniref:FMN-binding protein n=1 Tax=Marispirochaeta aestuarii TaxID=1963862 RepID=UPI002ABD308F|nr:FMN-binding protein [Marispirochaeta aestuarii]